MLVPLPIRPLAPVLEDLKLEAASVRAASELASLPEPREGAARALLCAVDASRHDVENAAEALRAPCAALGALDDHLLLALLGERGETELARWRDALWPTHHVGAVYELAQSGIRVRSLQGERRLAGASGHRATLLAARPRSSVFHAGAVAAKFDQNAGGWNATPGTSGYEHFRWMRRFVGTFADPAGVDRQGAHRILDFGCGAGWVGIEAALRAPNATLCAFDPSPAMVRNATENARSSGIARFDARVGFGEEPPYPAAGEERFDLVLSSGVISFSGDRERFVRGLLAALAPGGTLVIGDINPHSRGMARRRREKVLLPLRELNAPPRELVQRELEAQGLRLEAWSGYQLTSPIPELMHFSARRLGGALDRALLWWNERRVGERSPERFDSWVMRFARPA